MVKKTKEKNDRFSNIKAYEQKLAIIDAWLDLPLPFDEIHRQHPEMLIWIENFIRLTHPVVNNDNLKLAIKQYIIQKSPVRKEESEVIDFVLNGYFKGVVVVVSRNDESTAELIKQKEKENMDKALQEVNSGDFELQKLNLTQLEAMVVKKKAEYSISLYNALCKILNGAPEEELKVHGQFGELLCDTMKSVSKTTNMAQKISFIKTLVTAVPAQTNIMQYVQNIQKDPAQEQNANNDDKLQTLLLKVKEVN